MITELHLSQDEEDDVFFILSVDNVRQLRDEDPEAVICLFHEARGSRELLWTRVIHDVRRERERTDD